MQSGAAVILCRHFKANSKSRVCVQVVVRLSDELLSQAVMVVESCRPTLTINLAGARQHWLEGMLRHEIGNHARSHTHTHPSRVSM